MSTSRVINGFEKLSDAEFSSKVNGIIVALTDNINFTNPTPSLEVISLAKKEFEESLMQSKMGDRLLISIKNEKRKKLQDYIHSLGRYVDMVANNNRPILLSSGFDINKEHSSPIELGVPENIKIFDGSKSGEITVSCDRVAGAKSYIYQYTSEPVSDTTQWSMEISTKSEYTFKGLSPGLKYTCRIIAIGSSDQQTVSNTISRFVQ